MTGSSIFDRSGRVPRSAYVLAMLLVASAVALFVVGQRAPVNDLALGGPLLDLENAAVEGFLLTHGGAQYRFDRNESGYWTLRGAGSDFLEQGAVATFLNELGKAKGGRLLAGTEVEDRRYEFNSTESLRLTVFTTGGGRQSLALGTVNPVTGHYYASGVGRPGCFPVSEVFRHRLAGIPASLQLSQLLPRFDRSLIRQVEIWYGQEMHLLRRIDGRWWLRQPEKGLAALGNTAARAYHQQYDDRRIQRDEQTWLLAAESAVSQVIYEVSEIIVNDIPPSRLAQPRLGELELDPPWRRVKLYGAGINPDSTEAAADVLALALGPVQEDQRVPALRRGNVLMTESEAVTRLSAPLGDFLDVGAITFLVAEGDSLRARRQGQLVLGGIRGEAPTVRPGGQKRPLAESWRTLFPSRSQRPELRELSHNGLTRYLIINLDRLEILKVLPPVQDARIISEKERVEIDVVFGNEGTVFGTENTRQRLIFGYLDSEYLPAGSSDPVITDDGVAPVVLWRPDTGQLLQVPGHIVVTLRNHFTALKDQ